MKKVLISSLILCLQLVSAPVIKESFDMPTNAPTMIGSGKAVAGKSSAGWHSSWHLKEGESKVRKQDLQLAGLGSNQGLTSSKGKTVIMRQMAETITGDAYGSFRVRGSKLNANSMMALLFNLPNSEEINPKTAFYGFLASRWASELGALSIGGQPVKVEEGIGLQPMETALVLWKIDNLPEPGKKSDQVIQMWMLNEAQVAHFASKGMKESQLNKAKPGNNKDQVMQSARTALRGSKLTLAKGLVISCFSMGVPKADFDEIRISSESLADAAGVGGDAPVAAAPAVTAPRKSAKPGSPNVLFITMDDMNWDSANSYGCPIPGISPHIDSLADSGLRFMYGYNQTSSCVPSRNTYQTGRYPHTSGVLSFYNVDANFKTLPELMRDEGYLTGIVNKPRDTSITDEYDKYWDFHEILTEADKRGAPTYAEGMNRFFDGVAENGRPFYCVVNIADPHKPFFNDELSIKQGFDKFGPSKRYETEDVEIPGFLPQHPEIHEEMRNYYNSVKRGDDCVGAVLDALKKRGHEKDTIIIFISDHGMPLPYAKSSLYRDGLRTPFIVKWPGKISGNKVDDAHMVSAIDFMPTVLDLVGANKPTGIQGKSILPLLLGQQDPDRDHVFAEFNDNAGGLPFPMRAIHTKKYAYIFNAWGTGNHTFTSAATWHKSEGVMKRLSKTNPSVAERYDFLLHRCVEELYDLESDPYALNNLINDPTHAQTADELRKRLREQLKQTKDYALEAFDMRDDPAGLDKWMKLQDKKALSRAQNLQWKRYKNRAGGTGKNTGLYRPE